MVRVRYGKGLQVLLEIQLEVFRPNTASMGVDQGGLTILISVIYFRI